MKVSSVEQMRDMDRRAINELGIPEAILMENAGDAAYAAIRQEVGVRGRRFCLLCGAGNNGGDGFVVARKLLSGGAEVRVFVFSDLDRYSGAARANLDILLRLQIAPHVITSEGTLLQGTLLQGTLPKGTLPQGSLLQASLSACDAVVDALFGTGLSRDVQGAYSEAIDLINQSGRTVFSLDIPSGVHGDTGQVMGTAVSADFTICFGLPKLGNFFYPGSQRCGVLYVSHLSFPPTLYSDDRLQVELYTPEQLPQRDPAGHKGSFGDLLSIAGASSYYGAPFLAATSFLKAGGGYSRLAAPGSIVPHIAALASEIVFAAQAETSAGAIALGNQAALLNLAGQVDMVVVGPGLSLDSETQALVQQLASLIDKPLLIDGDGITAIALHPGTLADRTAPTILTPHLVEMSRLTNQPIAALQEDRIGVLQRTARTLKATIVLKGAHSLVGHPDGRVTINLSGNSGMATAGCGDVLCGTIAAMWLQNPPLRDPVGTGVFIHGLAGDLAAEAKGEDGITAQDILEHLPGALRYYRAQHETIVDDYYGRVRGL